MEITANKLNEPANPANDFDLKNPIEENWKDILRVEERFKNETGDEMAKFNYSIMALGAKRAVWLPMGFTKDNGRGGRTKKVYEQMIICHYCPFTGKPLYEEKENHENEIHRIIKLAKDYVANRGISKVPKKYRTWIIARMIQIFKVEIKNL